MSSKFSLEDFKSASPEVESESTAVESTPSETAIPDQTPAETPTETPVVSDPAAPASASTEQYMPDFTYEVKGEKKEIPAWMRSVVTSKEQEAQLKDLHTRATGLDAVKESRTKIEQEYQGYKAQLEPVIDKVGQFDYHVQTKNFAEAFKLAGIETKDVVESLFVNDESVRAIEHKLAAYYKALEQGPQAVSQFQGQYTQQQEKLKLTTELTQTQQQLQQFQNQALDFQLDQALAPHAATMSAYDAQKGAGAFKQFIKAMGATQWNMGNKMQPSEMVSYVVGGFNLAPQSNTQVPNTNQNQVVQAAVTAQPKPVIPNLGQGANQSNVGKVPNTMESLRASLKERSDAAA